MKLRALTLKLAAAMAACLVAPVLLAAPKIAVVCKSQSAFWAAAEDGAKKAGAEFGADIIAKSPLKESDVAIQIRLVNGLVEQGVDAIVIAPSSRDTLVAPLAAAAEKGIKVVLFDTRLDGEYRFPFVGTDQRAAGHAAGTLLSSMIDKDEPVGFLKHNQTSGAALQREAGAFDALREAWPDFSLCGSVYVGVEAGAEKQRIEAFFGEHPDMKAVLASSTPATMALIEVIKERGLAGKVKGVGFGFNLSPAVVEAIEQDLLAGWVAQLPGEMGYQGVKIAEDLLAGKPVSKVNETAFVAVTKENLHEEKVQALLKQ